LKKFKHENIVEFIDFLASKNSLYLVMEYCEQGDLKRYLTEPQMQDVLKQIIRGFYELNKMKITHRDLKPANILVSNNTFKIADFGFAKYVSNF
jgi:serine/threonine protein kinase